MFEHFIKSSICWSSWTWMYLIISQKKLEFRNCTLFCFFMYVHWNNCSEKLEKNNRNNLANMKYKDFAGLNNYIVNNRNELNSGSAINILINCCNICLDSTDQAGSSKHHLKNILNSSYNLISTLNEKQILSYTQAIYHIVKYLTEKVST